MSSFVWDRDVEEAYQNPYEYGAQDQFVREAEKVLWSLKEENYSKKNLTFHIDERSREKAIWMLQVDSLESMKDSLSVNKEEKHRIAFRFFRDAIETMDLSLYFYLHGDEGREDLEKW